MRGRGAHATALGSAAQTKQVKPGMTRYQGSSLSRATVTAVHHHDRRGPTAFGAKCCDAVSYASLSLDHQHPPPLFRAYFLHSCLLASFGPLNSSEKRFYFSKSGCDVAIQTLHTEYYFVFRNEATGLLLLRHPSDECGYLRSSV